MSDSTAKNSENWFSTWFDTPYYHILYKNRNDEEAQTFMDNITHYLNMPENGTILDLACGKGRHSIYLNKLAKVNNNTVGLQSLFTWIFYLFDYRLKYSVVGRNASILIHLDFLSIWNLCLR